MSAIAERPFVERATGPFTSQEARELFEKTAQQYMRMSGEEFIAKWEGGVFRDAETKSRAMRVAILIPLVRKISARKKPR